MFLRKISVPSYLKFASDCKELAEEFSGIIKKYSYKKILFVSGEKPFEILTGQLLDAAGSKISYESIIAEDNLFDVVDSIIESANLSKADVIVGVGGGKTLDVSKYSASKLNMPFISIPTQVSHDGICSPVAIIRDGKGKSLSLGSAIPIGILVPLDIVKEASKKSTSAGVGDLVSNITAVFDWKLAARVAGEQYDDYAAIIAHTAANSIYEVSNNKSDGEKIEFNEEFLTRLIEGLILSGIAMEISKNSRPCSGSEHKISHAMDALFESPALHGEQVAIGMIVATFLQKGNHIKLKNFFQEVGLPKDPREIGISLEQMAEAITYAPQTRPNRYTILEHEEIDRKSAERIVGNIWG